MSTIALQLANVRDVYRNPNPGKWGTVTADLMNRERQMENNVKIGVPSDMAQWQPAQGDVVYLLPNANPQYSKYRIVGAKTAGGQEMGKTTEGQSSGGGGYSGKKSSGGSSGGSNDYWAKKTDYEQNRRDPAIEFQAYMEVLQGHYVEHAKAINAYADYDAMKQLINHQMAHAAYLQQTWGQSKSSTHVAAPSAAPAASAPVPQVNNSGFPPASAPQAQAQTPAPMSSPAPTAAAPTATASAPAFVAPTLPVPSDDLPF